MNEDFENYWHSQAGLEAESNSRGTAALSETVWLAAKAESSARISDLATSIIRVATKLGLTTGDQQLTGPEVLHLAKAVEVMLNIKQENKLLYDLMIAALPAGSLQAAAAKLKNDQGMMLEIMTVMDCLQEIEQCLSQTGTAPEITICQIRRIINKQKGIHEQ